MRRPLAAAAVAALLLAGCGGTDDEAASDTSPETTASETSPTEDHGDQQDDTGAAGDDTEGDDGGDDAGGDDGGDDAGRGEAIEVELEGDQVDPSGRRVEVQAGTPIRLAVESDRAGEFHVHSSPEQTIPFEKGESVVRFRVETPGIVDVEEHETGAVVLQLEVR